MIFKRVLITVLILFCAFFIFSCASKTEEDESKLVDLTTDAGNAKEDTTDESSETKDLTLGEIQDGVYTNDYFNFKIILPSNWFDLDEEQRNLMQDIGKEAIAKDDAVKKKALELASQNTLSLFTLYEMDPLEAQDYNPSFSMVAEKLSGLSNILINTPEQYFEILKTNLTDTIEVDGIPIEYTFIDIENITLSGKEFSVMRLEASVYDGALIINQDYYATKADKYMISAILTYKTSEQKLQLETAMQSIAFNE